jgi:hypothetical protein
MSKESKKFKVPDALADLYDFANSLDVRHFIHHGVQHPQADELAGPRELGVWMSQHALSFASARITPAMFETALDLRRAVRDYLQRDPADRRQDRHAVRSLNKALELFPLVVEARGDRAMVLRPARSDALAGLSALVAELSKPATRRWCMSSLCGNRMKTRAYRQRRRSLA